MSSRQRARSADLERGRRTEVDIIGGDVSQPGAQMGAPLPVNAAMAAALHPIERKLLSAEPARLPEPVRRAG